MKNKTLTSIYSFLAIIAMIINCSVLASENHSLETTIKLNKAIDKKIDLENMDEGLVYLGTQNNQQGETEVYFWDPSQREITKWHRNRFRHHITLSPKRFLRGFGFTQGKNVSLLIKDHKGREQIERFSNKGQRLVHMRVDLPLESDMNVKVEYKNPFFYVQDYDKSYRLHKWHKGKHESFDGQLLHHGHGLYRAEIFTGGLFIRYYDEEGNIEGRKIYLQNNLDSIAAVFQLNDHELTVISEYEYGEESYLDLQEETIINTYQVRTISLDSYETTDVRNIQLRQSVDSVNHFWCDDEGSILVTNVEKNKITILDIH